MLGHVIQLAGREGGLGLADRLLGFADLGTGRQGQPRHVVRATERQQGERRLDQIQRRARRQIEKAVQLLLQVHGLFIDFLDRLPRLHQGGSRLKRPRLGDHLGAPKAFRGPRLNPPNRQQAPVELLDAARHFANPFLLLRLVRSARPRGRSSPPDGP